MLPTSILSATKQRYRTKDSTRLLCFAVEMATTVALPARDLLLKLRNRDPSHLDTYILGITSHEPPHYVATVAHGFDAPTVNPPLEMVYRISKRYSFDHVLLEDGTVCCLSFGYGAFGTVSITRSEVPISSKDLPESPYTGTMDVALAEEIIIALKEFVTALDQRILAVNSARETAFEVAKNSAETAANSVPSHYSTYIAGLALTTKSITKSERLRAFSGVTGAPNTIPVENNGVVTTPVNFEAGSGSKKRQRNDDNDSDEPVSKILKLFEKTVSDEVTRKVNAASQSSDGLVASMSNVCMAADKLLRIFGSFGSESKALTKAAADLAEAMLKVREGAADNEHTSQDEGEQDPPGSTRPRRIGAVQPTGAYSMSAYYERLNGKQ